jgi:hypothetical protein
MRSSFLKETGRLFFFDQSGKETLASIAQIRTKKPAAQQSWLKQCKVYSTHVLHIKVFRQEVKLTRRKQKLQHSGSIF